MAQAMYFLYRELNKCGLEIRLGLFGLILFFFFWGYGIWAYSRTYICASQCELRTLVEVKVHAMAHFLATNTKINSN